MATTTADVNEPKEEPNEEIDPRRIDDSNGKVRASVPVPNPQEQAKAKKK